MQCLIYNIQTSFQSSIEQVSSLYVGGETVEEADELCNISWCMTKDHKLPGGDERLF